ncbi:MAG: hypothetical protein K2W92_02905 [Alphaproteobacteria bacterium]|nr:hypothetical protein [Alphaproteobacteria bacterium]
MKKLLLVLSMALLGNTFAQAEPTYKPTLQEGKVFLNGNECKSVNYFYREYFKPTKAQVEAVKTSIVTEYVIGEDGAYRLEIEAPTAFGVQGDALLLTVADYISQGAEVTFNKTSKACTFIVKDKKYMK